MNVYKDIALIEKKNKTVVTIGTFDGLHLGHQRIIEIVKSEAEKNNGRSLLITFEPHPRSVVSKDYNLKLLTTTKEKIDLMRKTGLENILVINFTKDFSDLSAEEFIREYIVEKIGVSELIIGHDHRLGKDRVGDESKLKELGKIYSFDVLPVNAVKINDEIINSTKIRNALLKGDLGKANTYLGRYYSLSGKVVSGAKRGRSLGFPTANIGLEDNNKLIPANGIYIVEFFIASKMYYGLMNIGTRPTFEDSQEVVIEVYLYDFDEDIYGEYVSVNILQRLREEVKYPGREELIKQMEIDKFNGTKIIQSLIN
jgi:riboflavin kinase/FMN adenylyltransferase